MSSALGLTFNPIAPTLFEWTALGPSAAVPSFASPSQISFWPLRQGFQPTEHPMLGDQEDPLFLDEMARSTHRYEEAIWQSLLEVYEVLCRDCATSRERSRDLVGMSERTRDLARRVREESGQVRRYCKASRIQSNYLKPA